MKDGDGGGDCHQDCIGKAFAFVKQFSQGFAGASEEAVDSSSVSNSVCAESTLMSVSTAYAHAVVKPPDIGFADKEWHRNKTHCGYW